MFSLFDNSVLDTASVTPSDANSYPAFEEDDPVDLSEVSADILNASLAPTRCERYYETNVGGPAHEVLLFFFKALVALIGMIGNYLVIIVYKRKRDCHPSEFLILSIAVVDFLFCSLNMLFLVFILLSPAAGYMNSHTICTLFGCLLNSASYTFTTFTSLFLICVITVNRYVAICMPHDYSKYFNRTAVQLLILAAFAFGSVSCVSPALYCYGSDRAKLGGDIYWYSTKILLNIVNCVTLVIVYIKVLQQFRAKQEKQQLLLQKNHDANQPQPNNDNPAATASTKITKATADSPSAEIDNKDEPGSSTLTVPNPTKLGFRDRIRRFSDVEGSVFKDVDIKNGTASSSRSNANRVKLGSTKGQGSTNGSSREKRVTMTLFAISILYIIANLPSTLIESILWYNGEIRNKQIWLIPIIEKFSYLLYLTYFDLNPFIYFGSNSFYRSQVTAMFHDPVTFIWARQNRHNAPMMSAKRG